MTERGGDARRFDPRFDPAFQPGYDPRNDPAIAARSRSYSGSPHPVRPVRPEVIAPLPPAEPQNVPAEAIDEREVESESSATPGVNPFLIALWVVSALFVVSGAGLLRWLPTASEELQTSTNPAFDYVVLTSIGIGAPLLIVLGLATAAGILFLHAARWKRRAPTPE